MRLTVSAIAILSWCAAGALAQGIPQAIEILKQAEAASTRLNNLSYEANAYGEGEIARSLPKVFGRVIAQRGPSELEHKLAINGEIVGSSGTTTKFTYVCDGRQVYRIDHGQMACLTGTVKEAKVVETSALVPPHFFGDNPYAQELGAASTQVETSQMIGDVDCDVILVTYDRGGQREARFYFGKKDHLLRRLDRMVNASINNVISRQTVVFNCKDLKSAVNIDPTTFTLECPSGYTKRSFSDVIVPAPQPVVASNAPAMSPVIAPMQGGDAGDWTLRASDGREINLKSLRGHVVMLDFWATWCGPCKMAMPGVQKIHEHFKGKPVDVFGANCWEKGGPERALQFVKDKGYTYPQLLGADKVATAYGVRGIPAFFVIGPDGKFLHIASGFNPSADQQIISIIEQALASR